MKTKTPRAKKSKARVIAKRLSPSKLSTRTISRAARKSGWGRIIGTAAALGLTGAAYAYYRYRGELARTKQTESEFDTGAEIQTRKEHESDAEYMTS